MAHGSRRKFSPHAIAATQLTLRHSRAEVIHTVMLISGNSGVTGAPYRQCGPVDPVVPVLCSSPHSGRFYPYDFLARSALSKETLQRAEDRLVDRLLGEDSSQLGGAQVLSATYARSFIDLNRSERELDPILIPDLPESVRPLCSARVSAGLGVIPRVAGGGLVIYPEPLSFAEATERLDEAWRPFHHRLGAMIGALRRMFGHAVLLDWHSMPSSAVRQASRTNPVAVLGDLHGGSCAPGISRWVAERLRAAGFQVVLNTPYAGGFITRHYGQPSVGIHVLQIELSRAAYLDEATGLPGARFGIVGTLVRSLVRDLVLQLPRLLPAPAWRCTSRVSV